MRVYLAGPMTGIPQFNYPAFTAAAVRLRGDGHAVFSPAEYSALKYGISIFHNRHGDEKKAKQELKFDRREALAESMRYLCKEADAIALMPGWKESKGAVAEHAVAAALGLKVIELGAKDSA